ncbi:MAG: hypothetical protein AAF512_24840, partial [Pseudomonadota bacterium]
MNMNPIVEKLPKNLQQFFVPRRYLHNSAGVIQPTQGKGLREWVVSREFCYYRLFDLRNVDTGRQESALAVKIRQWSPFVDYGSYAVWHNGYAQVWVWDKAEQEAALSDQSIKQAFFMPETVLQQKTENGARLVECLEGIEGQVWREGALVGSRWWPTPPPVKTWQRFLRT